MNSGNRLYKGCHNNTMSTMEKSKWRPKKLMLLSDKITFDNVKENRGVTKRYF